MYINNTTPAGLLDELQASRMLTFPWIVVPFMVPKFLSCLTMNATLIFDVHAKEISLLGISVHQWIRE